MNKVMGIAILLLSYGVIAAGTQENDLLSLAKSGIEEQILISYINAAKGPFNLTADQIIELKDLGVSTKVISEALRHGKSAEAAAGEPTAAANTVATPPALSNESFVEPAAAAPIAPAYQMPAAPVAPAPPAKRDTVTVAPALDQTVYTYPWCWSPYYDYYWPYADAYDGWLWSPGFGWGFGLGLGWGYGWGHRPFYHNHGYGRVDAGAFRTEGAYGHGWGARGWGGGGRGGWGGGGHGGGWGGGGHGGGGHR